MKATIHFTEDNKAVIYKNEIFEGEAGEVWTDENGQEHEVIAIIDVTPDLLKKSLEAVIQKEAEEKYPDRNSSGNYLDYNAARQEAHINLWQSLLSRLPSEEEINKTYVITDTMLDGLKAIQEAKRIGARQEKKKMAKTSPLFTLNFEL